MPDVNLTIQPNTTSPADQDFLERYDRQDPTGQFLDQRAAEEYEARASGPYGFTPPPEGPVSVTGIEALDSLIGGLGEGIGNFARGLGSGAMDQLAQTAGDVRGMADSIKQYRGKLGPGPERALKAGADAVRPPKDSTAGSVGEGVGGFLSIFLPGMKAAKVAGLGKTLAPMAAGAAADVAAKPGENLANTLDEVLKYFKPGAKSEVLEYLKSTDEDPEALKRLKAAVVGGLAGAGADLVVQGLKLIKRRAHVGAMAQGLRDLLQPVSDFVNSRTAARPARPEEVFKIAYEAERAVFPDLTRSDFTGRVLEGQPGHVPREVVKNMDRWHETRDGLYWLELDPKSNAVGLGGRNP